MIQLPEDKAKKKQVLMALWRLAVKKPAAEDGIVVIEWLASEGFRLDRQNRRQKDGVQLAWAQGAGQLIEDFLHTVSNSKKIYDELEQSEKGGTENEGFI